MIIRGAWEMEVPNGSPMFRLFEKIKSCRKALVDWSRTTFGNFETQLQEKQAALDNLSMQNKVNHLPLIKSLEMEINNILHQDELFWRQTSRSIWLPAGDKNTKVFHQWASQRQQKNNISGLKDNNENWCTFEDQIAQNAEQYFQDLFTSNNLENLRGVLDSVDKVITLDMNNTLLRSYTANEVRRALFQMHSSKSPRPDGMSPFLFQKYWNIVGLDVSNVVLSMLNSGHMLHKMNYTHIVFIPKKNDPKKLSDFCPINLGNVISKILSKVIANRLKYVLPNVISKAQSALFLIS